WVDDGKCEWTIESTQERRRRRTIRIRLRNRREGCLREGALTIPQWAATHSDEHFAVVVDVWREATRALGAGPQLAEVVRNAVPCRGRNGSVGFQRRLLEAATLGVVGGIREEVTEQTRCQGIS